MLLCTHADVANAELSLSTGRRRRRTSSDRPSELSLRAQLGFHHDVTLALARITAQEIERRYRRLARAAGVTEPRGGSVTSI